MDSRLPLFVVVVVVVVVVALRFFAPCLLHLLFTCILSSLFQYSTSFSSSPFVFFTT